MGDLIGWIILGGIVLLFIVLFFTLVPVGLWVSCLAANVRVSIFSLVGMRLRRVMPAAIMLPLVKA